MESKKHIIDNPNLIAEWNWEKNNELGLEPNNLLSGSNKKAWWKCSKGHEWQAIINNRNKGNGCPYCSGRYAIKGENDLQTINHDLATEWNYEKNKDLKPSMVTANSGKKVWWKCKKGHEWQATIYGRNNGIGCPYCSGRYAIKGENDLQTVNPVLASEWNYEKNNGLTPTDVLPNSEKKVWWKCEKRHEWQAVISNRNNGNGCPICSNQQIQKGYNDLLTNNPLLASEWNYEKNGDLKPSKVTANSRKKVWWKCEKGHEWQAFIYSRNTGAGCPICSSQKIQRGYNDLLTITPQLASEWNHEKNGDLKPTMVMPNSNKKVWWKCEKGHAWQASVNNRNKGRGCPYCSSELKTSFPEQAIYFYIKKVFPDAINRDCHLGVELDIYIPSKQIAIEYDGAFWHKDKKRDERKNKFCKENKILLFRVMENTNHKFAEDEYLKIIPCALIDKGLETAIKRILTLLNKNINVNLERDRTDIYTSFINIQKEQSLLALNSELAVEWNYEKNGDLKPDMVTSNSSKKVWWKCKNGHEWQAVIYSRNNGTGCPICSGHQILKGYNDLLTINPKLANEWNYENNGDLKPDIVTVNSNKRVWWKCSKGHEWQAVVSSRNNGSGCPYCLGKKILRGYNDLQTTNPALANEWNYEKNNGLLPMDIMPNSDKKVWWKCSKGHEWQAVVSSRNNGSGCPICSGNQVLKGYNDLVTTNSKLVKEWNYERNGDLKPDMITSSSRKKVWWKCEKGHEWQAFIYSRNAGTGCPYCSGRYAIVGINDLQTVNPTLAKEWNYKKNSDLKPNMFTSGSGKKVWWKCEKGHEWQASINSRNHGNGCPYCSGRYTIEGENY